MLGIFFGIVGSIILLFGSMQQVWTAEAITRAVAMVDEVSHGRTRECELLARPMTPSCEDTEVCTAWKKVNCRTQKMGSSWGSVCDKECVQHTPALNCSCTAPVVAGGLTDVTAEVRLGTFTDLELDRTTLCEGASSAHIWNNVSIIAAGGAWSCERHGLRSEWVPPGFPEPVTGALSHALEFDTELPCLVDPQPGVQLPCCEGRSGRLLLGDRAAWLKALGEARAYLESAARGSGTLLFIARCLVGLSALSLGLNIIYCLLVSLHNERQLQLRSERDFEVGADTGELAQLEQHEAEQQLNARLLAEEHQKRLPHLSQSPRINEDVARFNKTERYV